METTEITRRRKAKRATAEAGRRLGAVIRSFGVDLPSGLGHGFAGAPDMIC
jgi:hypothetical protein